jgi:hypothetical protein
MSENGRVEYDIGSPDRPAQESSAYATIRIEKYMPNHSIEKVRPGVVTFYLDLSMIKIPRQPQKIVVGVTRLTEFERIEGGKIYIRFRAASANTSKSKATEAFDGNFCSVMILIKLRNRRHDLGDTIA